jgi:hypothetical protein
MLFVKVAVQDLIFPLTFLNKVLVLVLKNAVGCGK